MPTLIEVFPRPQDLLAVTVEDLAAALIEVIPGVLQNSGFSFSSIEALLYAPFGMGQQLNSTSYGHARKDEVFLALAEALSWLERHGLIVTNPAQHGGAWKMLTRSGQRVRSRADMQAFIKGRELPESILHACLVEIAYPLFLRGNYDLAILAAFKEVEVAVRRAGNYSDRLVGTDLMRKAFHPDEGPLRDQSAIQSEREAEMALFAGAIGYAKNPPSHRHPGYDRLTAARLLPFASQLLAIVDERRPA